jgi:hypothetical protein
MALNPFFGTQVSAPEAQAARGQGPFLNSEAGVFNPYDQLTNDKPGQELGPDVTIWKLYANEAKEFDAELTKGKNRHLDVMLVFVRDHSLVDHNTLLKLWDMNVQAALFLAILSAFLLDSKRLMEEDMSESSKTLLMTTAQRLQNPSTPVPAIEFHPTMAACWINGLWFTALALSLAAALIAMLAKEWLMTTMDIQCQGCMRHLPWLRPTPEIPPSSPGIGLPSHRVSLAQFAWVTTHQTAPWHHARVHPKHAAGADIPH